MVSRLKKTPKIPINYKHNHMGAIMSPLERKYTQLTDKEDARRSQDDDITRENGGKTHVCFCFVSNGFSRPSTFLEEKCCTGILELCQVGI